MYRNINHCLILIGIFSAAVITGCKNDQMPLVSTTLVSEITESGAIAEGVITDAGTSPVTALGVCYSTNSKPVISDLRTSESLIAGSFRSRLTGLEKGKKYFVRTYAVNSHGTAYGNELEFITADGPVKPAFTLPAFDISDNSAKLKGTVTNSTEVTKIFFEYGTTTAYGKIVAPTGGSNSGEQIYNLTTELSELLSGTIYHCRIVEINSSDTIQGNDITFKTTLTDVDGNKYNTVSIGDQVWMSENLRTLKYNNSDPIPTTSIYNSDITGHLTPQYQWPCTKGDYGRFYTYYTVTDPRNVCPVGWHVPDDDDWTKLTDYMSQHGYGYKGNSDFIAKAMAATYSFDPDTAKGNVGNDQLSNNSSGFSGAASGGRYSNGIVHFVGQHGIWWSSTESTELSAYFRCIGYLPARVFRGEFKKSYGLPVRCLRND